MSVVQGTYEVNPDVGFPGAIARPYEPHALDSGLIHVPTGATRRPRPGDAVVYDQTEDAYKLPTSDAESLEVAGILSYRADTVQDASQVTEFADGDEVEVAVLGTWWVRAGSAVEYGDRLAWDRADFKWDPQADPAASAIADLTGTVNLALVNQLKDAVIVSVNAALASLSRIPIVCVSRFAGADTDIVMARIGFGRVN